MEIIDYHVHIGIDRINPRFKITPEEIMKDMKKYQIKKSVIFSGLNPEPKKQNPYYKTNREILKISEKYPELIPFMFVHPYRDSIQELENLSDKFKGYKLHPHAIEMEYSYDKIHELDTIKFLEKTKKPILFHIGMPKGERIKNLLNLIENTSSTIILAHAGRFFKSDLEEVSKYPNIYIDLAGLRVIIENKFFISKDLEYQKTIKEKYKILKEFLGPLFNQRILWGSDRPWSDYAGKKGFKGEIETYQIFKQYLGKLKLD